MNKKGIVLFMVLATIFIVILLANILINIITSRSRLTHHQVSRIQAYYASMAGINYALENLRTGAAGWPLPAAGTFYIQTLTESNFPASVQGVTIAVASTGTTALIGGIPVPGCDPCTPPVGVNTCICTTSTYTYTP